MQSDFTSKKERCQTVSPPDLDIDCKFEIPIHLKNIPYLYVTEQNDNKPLAKKENDLPMKDATENDAKNDLSSPNTKKLKPKRYFLLPDNYPVYVGMQHKNNYKTYWRKCRYFDRTS